MSETPIAVPGHLLIPNASNTAIQVKGLYTDPQRRALEDTNFRATIVGENASEISGYERVYLNSQYRRSLLNRFGTILLLWAAAALFYQMTVGFGYLTPGPVATTLGIILGISWVAALGTTTPREPKFLGFQITDPVHRIVWEDLTREDRDTLMAAVTATPEVQRVVLDKLAERYQAQRKADTERHRIDTLAEADRILGNTAQPTTTPH